MSLKHGLLGLLNYGPMTGYELDKAFKASLTFFWQAKTSQIYRELSTMEENGWLSSQRVLQTEKPNKRVYTITATGKKELLQWLSSPEGDISHAMQVRSPFLMRMFFAGEMDTEHALSLLRAYRQQCLESKAGMLAAHAAIDAYSGLLEDKKKAQFWEMTLLYGEAFRKAGLDWAERAIALLEEEKT